VPIIADHLKRSQDSETHGTEATDRVLPDCKRPATGADQSARHTTHSEARSMLSPHLTSSVNQQHIADLHRAAARHRLVHAIRDARRRDPETDSVSFRRLRRRLTHSLPVSR
jgi:hypothetical protein